MKHRKIPPSERTIFALRAHSAFHMMRNGVAGKDEWHSIADAVNIIEALCDLGKSTLREHAELAKMGMVQATRTRPMAMDADYLESLRMVVNAYDDALGRFADHTICAACAIVRNKLAQSRNDLDATVVEPTMELETC